MIIKWKTVELTDKNIMDKYLKNSDISDLTFTNLMLWKSARKIEYSIINNLLCIKTTYPGKNPYFYPILGEGDLIKTVKLLIENTNEAGELFEMHSVSESYKSKLEGLKVEFDFIENRDRFDYLYSVEELINLSGKKFHQKKNHLNRFKKKFEKFSYENITENNREELLISIDEWCEKHKCGLNNSLLKEKEGILFCLKNFDTLDFKGGLIRAKGKIISMSIGERLNENTAVIHIEKADPEIREGYAVINNEFLKNEWSDFEFVNREEDLGLEGLRKAKLSYKPVELIKKYDVLPKGRELP